MITTLRRMFWLAVLGGAGYAGWTTWQRRTSDTPAAAPEWPPLDPPPSPGASDPVAAAVPSADAPTSTASTTWVEPLDGACPEGYPIKANDKSGIFHVPGGRFYERTVPERCYADAHDAEADGYRQAKA
jgi:hypothetical protein